MRALMILSSLSLFSLLLIVGCGSKQYSEASIQADYTVSERAARVPNGLPPLQSATENFGRTQESESVAELATNEPPADADRKIIYSANIELVVEQFDDLEKRIKQAIKQAGGYLAKVNLDRMQGEQRFGNWTARIPVDQYQSFLDAVAELGVPISQTQDAQDVTEEFVDLTARIVNQKKLEKRILELLDRPDDKISHVIEVEKELARVREQIERMEGRIRFLSDKTDLTTVMITAREERDYQPPQAPTFDNRISSAWLGSITNTKTFFANLIVMLAGGVVPLTITIVGLIAFWFLIGRRTWRWLNSLMTQDEQTVEEVAT